MMISKDKIILLLTILLLFVTYTGIAVERNSNMRDLVREVHELIKMNKEAGTDVSRAIELDNRARRLARSGREIEAKKLLSEAIELLKSNNLKKVANALSVTPSPPVLHPANGKQNVGESDFIFGIMVAPSEASAVDKMETYFGICKELGAPFLKIGILWDLVEPINGSFVWKAINNSKSFDYDQNLRRLRTPQGPPINNSKSFDYDQMATLAQKYNVSIIPTFLRSKQPQRETNPEKYAAFVYAFVNRYKTSMNIKYIEFQNEPNSGSDGSSGGRHWSGTAEDLARVNSSAYEKIKSAYPDIMVGTAGFITGSKQMISQYTEKFYERYFKANPKFDVFMLHEYPKNMNYTQGSNAGDLTSQLHIFESYRNMLKSYGYGDKPILVSEGYDDKPYKNYLKPTMDWMDEEEAATLFAESYVLTVSNAKKHNVIGKVITGVRTGSNQNIGLVDARTGEKRLQYHVVKEIISLFRKYPLYSKHISGEINTNAFWIEEFKNSAGEKLWIAFNPMIYTTDDELLPTIISKTMKYPQSVKLNVGDVSEVQILKVTNGSLSAISKVPVKGEVAFDIGKSPVFVYKK